MAAHILFVTGGARSGKSRFAQARAEASGLAPVYIATAEAWDDEMRERIRLHQSDRGADWVTVEAPLALPQAIADHARADRVLLVDCLTLWTSNLLLAERDMAAATEALLAALAGAAGQVILVTNEVGMGIVPDDALARIFRDEAGRLNQRVAAAANEAILVASGLPLRLK